MKPSQKALEAQAFNQGALLVAYAVVVAIFVLSDGIAHTVAYWMLMGAVGGQGEREGRRDFFLFSFFF